MTRLREAWDSPPVTSETARELMQMRDIFGLSFDDHLQCEGEIRLQVYVTEVEKEIRKGRIRSNDESSLEGLKRKFQITSEESVKVEPHVLAAFQRATTKAVILVVDDEVGFLESVKAVLEGFGYGVLTTQSPNEAMKLLETTSVDMIISDVMFSGTDGDGFSFYEKIQKVPRLKKVPFILMSGLHESFFIRTGVQLGVDNYLTKPIDPDMLAAVIEGKLKKYKSLRESD
jgi:CheY-like chemotaxis protein